MVKDDHDQAGRQAPITGTDGRDDSPRGGVGLATAVVLLAAVAGLTAAGTFAARWLFRDPGAAQAGTSKGPEGKPPLFAGWEKPDLVLLLSGQQHGYVQPCGCTRPQRGGLLRRYNLLQNLRQRGWTVVPLDSGDVGQTSGPRDLPNVQGLLKYRYSMEALRLMDYLAVGVGQTDGSLPLKYALDEWALNNPTPQVLCANLKDKAINFPGEVNDAAVTAVKGAGLKLAVVAVVGEKVAGALEKANDPQVRFEKRRPTLERMLAQVNGENPDVRVLLYQGYAAEARLLIQEFPQFQVVLALSEDDEGPSQPELVGSTCLVGGTGHKGKNVGVLGIYKTGNPQRPLRVRYQQVPLGEEWQTPKTEMSNHPVAQLMERYTKELKEGGYLEKYGQSNHPLQVEVPGAAPKYVGSKRCASCHEAAYDVWKNSKHAHAYQTLAEDVNPSLRQYDGECIVCHVTGFGYTTGYVDEAKTPRLKDVGCEVCHGPGSSHSNDPENPKWYALMNPWKAKAGETAEQKLRRELDIERGCIKCHDVDNDMHWKFDDRWAQIIHHTPKEKN